VPDLVVVLGLGTAWVFGLEAHTYLCSVRDARNYRASQPNEDDPDFLAHVASRARDRRFES